MELEWNYRLRPSWPSQAWLAELQNNCQSITVHVGSAVECTDDWFCEAVWDGDFEQGDFDQTDDIAGSGGRLRGNCAVFVTSGFTIDRLFHLDREGSTCVSNSFVALFAHCGLRVDPGRYDYPFFLASIVGGLKSYQRILQVDNWKVEATYIENLVWNGSRLTPCQKPRIPRDFSSFHKYENFLTCTMQAFIANARDTHRRHPFEPLVPMSSGYDSSAVAVLAKSAGAEDAMCIALDRDAKDDNAESVASHLGYRMHTIDRDVWKRQEMPEASCLAGSGGAGEVAMLGDPELLHGRLLLTGFHGDAVWTLDENLVSDDWKRKDGSGLCLTEPRLSIGFVNCPVPFWGLHQVRDIFAISVSDTMQPWDTGGSYSRPIPRRLVESAGVSRESFGIHKRGVSDLVLHAGGRLTQSSEIAYSQWVRRNAASWLRKGRIPPFVSLGRAVDYIILRFLVPNVRRISRWLGMLGFEEAKKRGKRVALNLVNAQIGSRRYATTWAIEEAMKIYHK